MWKTIRKPIKTMNIYMKAAFKEALEAYKKGEVPVGCVIVKDGKIIGKGHNLVESTNLTTGHAEILAIESACKALGSWRLIGCEIYITLEPCTMCMGAILHARIGDVHIGALDPVRGSALSKIPIIVEELLPSSGKLIYEESPACSYLLTRFFRELRREKQK